MLRPPADPRQWLLLLFLLPVFVNDFAGNFISDQLSLDGPYSSSVVGEYDDMHARLDFGLLSMTLTLLVEEIDCRGILVRRWAFKWGLGPGLIASSALFGALHPGPISATLFGLVACFLFLKSRSLLIPILFHAGYNAIVFPVAHLDNLFGDDSADTAADAAVATTNWTGVAIASAVWLASLAAIIWAIRRHRPFGDANSLWNDT